MRGMVDEPEATPSARILDGMRSMHNSFFEFAMSASRGHRDYFGSIAPLADARRDALEQEARQSHQRQADIETSDNIDFDEYLARYFAAD